MFKVPKSLETLLLSYVKKKYLPDKRVNPKTADEFTMHDIKFFARGVAEMSSYFTNERSHLVKNYLNKKELRAGYILYFIMPNFLKILFTLKEADLLSRFKNNNIIKIADVGCGPGTAALACAEYFRETPVSLEITALDQNSGTLHDAKHIFGEFADLSRADLKTVLANLHYKNVSRYLKDKFDIIITANLFSEMSNLKEQSLFIAKLSESLDENGVIIIIEPALRWTTRNLMKFRDMVVCNTPVSGLVVKSPCLHEKPCPMLSGSHRDWCHMYLEWERPQVIKDFDKLIGNYKDYLKFSYLIFELSHHRTITPSHQVWRVVSAPMYSKGKTELLLCNSSGLNKVSLQDKNRSPSNADFERVRRGDLVKYSGGSIIDQSSFFKIL